MQRAVEDRGGLGRSDLGDGRPGLPAGLSGALLAFLGALAAALPASGQATIDDYRMLRINEILASNDTVMPVNCRCRHVDMIEIYNASDTSLALDNANLGYVRFTDNSRSSFCTDPQDPSTCPKRYLTFKNHPVRNILQGERIVIFADVNRLGSIPDCGSREDACAAVRQAIDPGEVAAPFGLERNGETLTLEFVPADGSPPVLLDEVLYPPLREDVSYGRFPDGADNWVFSSNPTFGTCAKPSSTGRPSCLGTANNAGNPIPPDIDILDYATNSPAANQPAIFRARVADEKSPGTQNIVGVEIRYRVGGGAEQKAPMSFKSVESDPLNSLHTWSVWEGSIPGQPAGSEVEFYFWARDADGEEGTDPGSICPPGVGPCDSDDVPPNLGPGCETGQDCRTPFRYTVGTTYTGPLVITECIPNNDSVLDDSTDPPCEILNPNCKFDDFIEIHNTSGINVSLEGFWLSEKPFRPDDGWQFPFGSEIGPNEYLVVWIDNDGHDPEPNSTDPPNPNDAARKEYHTSFGINAGGDELFLFDTRENKFQLIDGIRWENTDLSEADPRGVPRRFLPILADESLSRCPDASRSGRWSKVPKDLASPKATSNCPGIRFKRGDANVVPDGAADISDAVQILGFLFLGEGAPGCQDAADVDDSGSIDISDAIGLLGHLFLGDPAPPAPGKDTCGEDPTEDLLPECSYPESACGG